MPTITQLICRLIHRSIRQPTHLGWHIDWHPTDMSTDIVDRYIGWVSADMSPEMSTNISVEGCTKYTWSDFFTLFTCFFDIGFMFDILLELKGAFFYHFWLLKSSPITKVVLISKLQFDWIWFTNLISRVSLPPTPWKEERPWEQGWDLYRKVVN